MSGYTLRSRVTKVGTPLDEVETTPPDQHPTSVSSATSHQNNAFGRGGRDDESSSGTGRGDSGPLMLDSSRRERGINVPRFHRSPRHERDLESDDLSVTLSNMIKAIEETKQEDEVNQVGAISKIPLDTEFDVFQTFQFTFAQTQAKEECEFLGIEGVPNTTLALTSTAAGDPKVPEQITLQTTTPRLTVHNTPPMRYLVTP
jgi:hypothetical protein